MPSDFPTDPHDDILAEIKSRKAARQSRSAPEEKIELVIFTLNDDYYAFRGTDVSEILPYEPPTFVPGCPDVILGIINVRGDIESVADIRKILGVQERPATKETRIIMAGGTAVRSGVLADSVEDVIEVPAGAVQPPVFTLDRRIREYALGGETLYKDRYVTIMDIDKLFESLLG